ncbi:hypothetical protein [Methanococcoides sp. AM1]|uniref:hypothetical protein n=1 Tax=Methanococcoides sp. AM1 TaxID=1201011 RepID=UPI0014384394|nr:hypothetical protein [Methanococcoides sp. AM1]
MLDFQPSVTNCRARGCPHLISKKIDTVAGDRFIKVCDITGKIPGNMAAVKECDA